MNEAKLIGRLKQTQQEHALQTQLQPSGKDLFTCGQVSGVVIGLEKAIEIVINMIKEEKDGENDF